MSMTAMLGREKKRREKRTRQVAQHYIPAEWAGLANSGRALCGVMAGSANVVLDTKDVTCRRCQKVLSKRVREMNELDY